MLLLFFLADTFQLRAQVAILDSGGEIMPEQAAYDVHFYDLDLNIDPDEKSIDGTVNIQAEVVHPLTYFVLDLDTLLRIEQGLGATRG